MASTNSTPNLGLNSWIETDRPKRMDFVSDNNIIDSVLGAHLSDASAHLTQLEKDKGDEPFKTCTIYGTGEASTNYRFNFNPTLVIAYRINGPVSEYSNSKNYINSAIATPRGSSRGISLDDNLVTLFQGAVQDTNYYNNMNEEHSQYVVIAFK